MDSTCRYCKKPAEQQAYIGLTNTEDRSQKAVNGDGNQRWGANKQLEHVTVRTGRGCLQAELLGQLLIFVLLICCTALLHGTLSQQSLLCSFLPGEAIDLFPLPFLYPSHTIQALEGLCSLCPTVIADSSAASLWWRVDVSCFCRWISWASLWALPFLTSLCHRLRAGTVTLCLGARHKGSYSHQKVPTAK